MIDAARTARSRATEARSAGATIAAWEVLAGPADARASILGRPITMFGVALPLDRTVSVRELLLVPSLWDCAFLRPPGPENTVRVRIPESAPVDWSKLDGRCLRIDGQLARIRTNASERGLPIRLRLDATAVEVVD